MDELERELKTVQLLREQLVLEREQLALERELARKGTGAAMAAPFISLGSFLSRRWKLLLVLLTTPFVVLGGIVWKMEHDRDAQAEINQLKQKHWNIRAERFALQECPEERFACSTAKAKNTSDDLVCASLDVDRASCKLRAFEEFRRREPLF